MINLGDGGDGKDSACLGKSSKGLSDILKRERGIFTLWLQPFLRGMGSRGIIFVFTERPGKMGKNSGGKEFKEDENLPLQRLLKLFLNQAAVSDRAV